MGLSPGVEEQIEREKLRLEERRVKNEEKQGRGWRAFIGPVTLAVPIVAVLATYYLSRHAAQDVEAKRAIGASRLLAANLRRQEDEMDSAITDCRFDPLTTRPVSLPHEDLVLLAWRLSGDQWEPVADAIEKVERQFDRTQRAQQKESEFQTYEVHQIQIAIDRIDKARRALAGTSGVQAYPKDTVAVEITPGSCAKALKGPSLTSFGKVGQWPLSLLLPKG